MIFLNLCQINHIFKFYLRIYSLSKNSTQETKGYFPLKIIIQKPVRNKLSLAPHPPVTFFYFFKYAILWSISIIILQLKYQINNLIAYLQLHLVSGRFGGCSVCVWLESTVCPRCKVFIGGRDMFYVHGGGGALWVLQHRQCIVQGKYTDPHVWEKWSRPRLVHTC